MSFIVVKKHVIVYLKWRRLDNIRLINALYKFPWPGQQGGPVTRGPPIKLSFRSYEVKKWYWPGHFVRFERSNEWQNMISMLWLPKSTQSVISLLWMPFHSKWLCNLVNVSQAFDNVRGPANRFRKVDNFRHYLCARPRVSNQAMEPRNCSGLSKKKDFTLNQSQSEALVFDQNRELVNTQGQR